MIDKSTANEMRDAIIDLGEGLWSSERNRAMMHVLHEVLREKHGRSIFYADDGHDHQCGWVIMTTTGDYTPEGVDRLERLVYYVNEWEALLASAEHALAEAKGEA